MFYVNKISHFKLISTEELDSNMNWTTDKEMVLQQSSFHFLNYLQFKMKHSIRWSI